MTATGFKTVETGQQMAGKVRDTKKKQLEERSATNLVISNSHQHHDWIYTEHIRGAEYLRSKVGQKFTNLQKTLSTNCKSISE